jgi:hypothetical protein
MNKKILRAAVLASAMLALGAPAISADENKAEAPSEMIIYDNALAPGWENWSWATTELSIEVPGSPRKPIRVESAPWQALYLHRAPFKGADYKRITFLIQGTVPEAEVRLFALVDGKAVGEGRPVKFKNTGWTKVEVPLVTLGIEDQLIDGFWLQNGETELPKYYVTDIKLFQ